MILKYVFQTAGYFFTRVFHGIGISSSYLYLSKPENTNLIFSFKQKMYRERAGTIRVGGSTNPQKGHYADSKGNLMLIYNCTPSTNI